VAAELVTPVDELSGLPLPIAPTEYILPQESPNFADWHHHFHPASHEDMKSIGGIAIRNCRVQLVARRDHNEGPSSYHRFYSGPPIPEEENDQFSLTVLACAGYIPSQAIDLRSGEPKVVDLSHTQQKILRQRQDVFGYRNLRYAYDPIRSFYTEYSMSRDISCLNEIEIEEFLTTKDELRQKFLGHFLLAQVVKIASEDVHAKYIAVRRAGLLHPFMPAEPYSLVKYKLGANGRREELFPRLGQRFKEQYGIAEAA